MRSKTKQLKITISEVLYEQIKRKTNIIGISIPQFIKYALLKEAAIHHIKNFDEDLDYLSKRVKDADLAT
jgi:hypothetical protein